MNPNGGAETSCSSVRRSTDTEFGFGHCCVTIAAGSDPLLYLVSVVVAAKQGGACRSTLKRLTLSEIIEIGGPAYKEDDRQRLQAALRLGPRYQASTTTCDHLRLPVHTLQSGGGGQVEVRDIVNMCASRYNFERFGWLPRGNDVTHLTIEEHDDEFEPMSSPRGSMYGRDI